jgi:hypothetical protein
MRDYTFDIVGVATFHVSAPDYATARRAAEGVGEFSVRDNTVDDSPAIEDILPVISWELTCVSPRGPASLFDADPEDPDIPAEDYQTFTEPLTGDARDRLREALAEADEALGGDSNDAEHDALFSVRETIAGLLGVTTEAPSPDYDGTEDVPMEVALEAARKLGAEHGHTAGTWAFDGNTTMNTYRRALEGIRAGDPAVLDSFPGEPRTPGETGEYTFENLFSDLDLIYEETDPDEIAQIADAYQAAAQDAFWAEVERAARYQVEGE